MVVSSGRGRARRMVAGVGIDGILMLVQAAIAATSASLLYSLRRRSVAVAVAADTAELVIRRAV